MPLGARDVLVIIHAKDQASRVISGVGRSFTELDAAAQASALRSIAAGTALLGVGTAMAAVGAVGISVLSDMVSASIAYTNQASLTLTQVDQLGVSLEDIKNIGREVAAAVPAPFEQMQAALFDIFSSIDVNLPEAKMLLEGFSKAAVAGGTDVQTAGRATIAILNAWQLPVSDLNHVLDVQFQLVRKGVGTYEEFATSIGKAIPSARRAGQQVETLAGMLAFMTRNGLSASMASTSAARAFDLISNSKADKKLQEMGVAVFDSAGNYRQMGDIVKDLAGKLDGLTDAQKAQALADLFKGAGNNIQARRFFDLAIRDADALQGFIDNMINSSGALENAYKIMLDNPAMMMQALANNWDILKTNIGDALVPVLMLLVGWLTKVFKAFNDLSPQTKEWIAKIALATSAALVFFGVLLALAGILLILQGTAELMGTSLLAMGGWFLLAVGIIAVAAYLIVKHWDTIKAWVQEQIPKIKAAWADFMTWFKETWADLWPKAKAIAKETWDWIQNAWDFLWPHTKQVASAVWDWMKRTWDDLWPRAKSIAQNTWNWMLSAWEYMWPRMKSVASDVWQWIQTKWDFLWPHVKEVASTVWNWLTENAPVAWNAIKAAAQFVYDWFVGTLLPWFQDTFLPAMQATWNWLRDNVPPAWQAVKDAAVNVYDWIVGTFWPWFRDTFGPGFTQLWLGIKENVGPILYDLGVIFVAFYDIVKALWPLISTLTQAGWTMVAGEFRAGLEIIRGILDIIVGILTLNWRKMWQGLIEIGTGLWRGTAAPFIFLWAFAGPIFKAIWDLVTSFWDAMWDGLKGAAQAGVAILSGLLSLLMAPIRGLIALFQWIIDNVHKVWDAIVGAFNHALDVTGLSGPLNTLVSILQHIVDLAKSIPGLIRTAVGAAAGAGGGILNGIPGLGGILGFLPDIMTAGGPQGIAGGIAGRDKPRVPTPAEQAQILLRAQQKKDARSSIILNIQGPIQDRQDLVYHVSREIDWHDFTRGK